jgi:hypothetical protein
MLELADIFRRYGAAYLQRFGKAMLPSHRRAVQDIIDCRTEALGGHVFVCDHCGHQQYAYHSCRNRSCPKCHKDDTEAWLEARRKELLPVPYFHVIFTLPQELRHCVRRHQKKLCGILMKAAAQALIKLAADPHYVGGLIGVLAVLQTWTRALVYHPHVHCLVPAGGVCADGQAWVDARVSYLVPVEALSRIFRGLFRELAGKALPDLRLPESVWQTQWVVHCKPALQGTERVLDYLARYVHRVAITNNRILSMDDGKVTFGYKDSRDACWRTMSLPAEEFIRRFLQHVLPSGFHKVRYYGLWSPGNRRLLRQVQLRLATAQPVRKPDSSQSRLASDQATTERSSHGLTCPRCKVGALLWSARIPRRGRGPP